MERKATVIVNNVSYVVIHTRDNNKSDWYINSITPQPTPDDGELYNEIGLQALSANGVSTEIAFYQLEWFTSKHSDDVMIYNDSVYNIAIINKRLLTHESFCEGDYRKDTFESIEDFNNEITRCKKFYIEAGYLTDYTTKQYNDYTTKQYSECIIDICPETSISNEIDLLSGYTDNRTNFSIRRLYGVIQAIYNVYDSEGNNLTLTEYYKDIKIDMDINSLPFRFYGNSKSMLVYSIKGNDHTPHSQCKSIKLFVKDIIK